MPSAAASSSSADTRPYDLVIYGAYGYTGTLTVEYLATMQQSNALNGRYNGMRWAVAGRSKAKLDALVAGISSRSGAAVRMDAIVASTDDAASLDAMCAQTRVLLSFAGPYLRCGVPVVEACVRNGTHYMDITGEMQFIRKLVDDQHEAARKKKVALVNSCGFDCVPSDVGAFMMHLLVENGGVLPLSSSSSASSPKARRNSVSKRSASSPTTPRGGGSDGAAVVASDTITSMEGFFTITGDLSPSGGTAATLSNTFLTQTEADKNPLSINPPQFRANILAPIRLWMRWTPLLKKYSGPFLMACENERIVRRSNCLLGRPHVSYSEAVAGGFMTVAMELLQFWAITILMPIAFFNKIVMLFLPKAGDGPDAKTKQGSKYQATFLAKTAGNKRFKGEWYDDRNAYDTTAVFVTEIAYQLLLPAKANVSGLQQFGVITPTAALGQPLLDAMKECCGIRTEFAEISQARKSQ